MSRAICAIVWEVVWKNRWVFPALLLLWAIGGLMAYVHDAPPDVWWAGNPFWSALLAFFTSLLLIFSPFTLMEGHGGGG
jgi:hypothetical protein